MANRDISRAGSEYSMMAARTEKVCESMGEAESLVREFNAAFPESEIEPVIGTTKGASALRKSRVFFRGNIHSEPAVVDWLKQKGVIE